MRSETITAIVDTDAGAYRVCTRFDPYDPASGAPEGWELLSLTRPGSDTEVDLREFCALQAAATGVRCSEDYALEFLCELAIDAAEWPSDAEPIEARLDDVDLALLAEIDGLREVAA